MRILPLILLVMAALAVAACVDSGPEPLSTPATVPTTTTTPDIDATVDAGIAATQEADSSIRATVEAQVAETLAAPTTTPVPQLTPQPAPASAPTAASTPTMAPTETPTPTAAPAPTSAPTAAPTPTMAPTETPTPTAAPAPTSAPTDTPAPTAAPTRTPVPTSTAIPTTVEGRLTGYWYRNADWEYSLTEVLKETDSDTVYEVRVVTLDANPDRTEQDFAFSLGCIGPAQVAYLSPYSGETLDHVESFAFGIWDEAAGDYLEDRVHFYSSAGLADNGSSIYITSNAQLRQIIDTLTHAAEAADPAQYIISGMWGQERDDDSVLWSEFDPAGIGDALQYLGCFRDAEKTYGTRQSVPASLREYAARRAGGPGAIYVGDLNQLAGPAPTREQGYFDGNVPREGLERHLWIYESPFYQELIEKAKLTNPTPMTYHGETITIRHTCINRALLPCMLLETFFAPNLLERTGGKLEFITTSFPDLGLAGTDTLRLLNDGDLDSTTVYSGYVEDEMPAIAIVNLWGIYSSREQEFAGIEAIIKDIEELVLAETGGVIMNHNWYTGNDQFLFCRDKIDTLDGFAGKKTRSHSATLSDWINGMGASARYVAFAEVYRSMERGALDCAVTGADAGYGQRWYEVTDFLMGPLPSFPFNNNVINAEKWASIPEDLQQIILEEAAKSELEALRLASIQNEMGLIKLTTGRGAGRDKMEFVPFSYEIKYRGLDTAAAKHLVPAWVNRVGDPTHPIIADTFNNKVGPIVGLHIEADGSVVKIPITQGPYSGKTVEQALSE